MRCYFSGLKSNHILTVRMETQEMSVAKYSRRFKKRTLAKFVITVFHCLKLFRDGKSTCLEDFEPEEHIGGMSGRTGPTRIEAAGP